MASFFKRVLHVGAFIGKEINEVRRQPRLLLSLILGPFLILLVFGVGYQGESGVLTAIFVVPQNSSYSRNVQDYQKLVGSQLVIKDLTTDQQAALDRLRAGESDLVVVIPDDVVRQVSSGSQAIVPVYFNEVDPLRVSWVTYLTYLYVSEINRQTVAAAAGQGQESVGDIRSAIARMRNALAAVEQHMERGEVEEARSNTQTLRTSSSNAQLGILLLGALLTSDTPMLGGNSQQGAGGGDGAGSGGGDGGEGEVAARRGNLAEGRDVTQRISSNVQELSNELEKPNPDRNRVRTEIGEIRADLDTLDRLTGQFQQINPMVLAAPFYADARNIAPVRATYTSFYAPGVLVLLLQHMAVTLGALSMVRERLLGTVELFRVSPVTATEIMVGKYISFSLLLGGVAAVLLVLMTNNFQIAGFPTGLGVPMLGDWWLLALTLGLVVFASVGLGFFISTVSQSESQAVQLTMMVLLASVFFGGFFLRLETLWPPVWAISYALPVTYGISATQTIMLRGAQAHIALLPALIALGLLFALASYVRFSKAFKRG
jgi:ABC-2 type transport system permease protein